MIKCFTIKLEKIGYSSLIILMISFLNVLITNAIHYGLQRYFAYTFGLMYILLILMLKELYQDYYDTK